MFIKKYIVLLLLFFSFQLFANDKIAIIVGINDYDILSDLSAGVNDAEKMASYYNALGFKVWLLTDRSESRLEKPSLQNLERVLDNVKELTEGEAIKEFVFFFAGHGVQISGNNYLCFPEAIVTNDIGMLDVSEVLLPWIKKINSDLNILYLDACRNDLGSMRAAGVERGLEVVGFSNDSSSNNEIVIFYAAKPGQFSYEKPDGSNGFFTDTLLEALQSPRNTNIGDLYTYIRQVLPERTEKNYGRPQIPHLGGDFDLTSKHTRGQVELTKFDTSGKIFIESSEPGALVKINGIIRGKTPLLVENLNPGNIFIEAELKNLYGKQTLKINPKSFETLEIEMKPISGQILINSITTISSDNQTSKKQGLTFLTTLDIYINGVKVKSPSNGLLTSMKIGSNNIVIKNDDWYWEEIVTIEHNDPKKLNIQLNPIGDITINLRKGSVAKLKGPDGIEIISDKAIISEPFVIEDLPIGRWNIEVSRTGDKKYNETINLNQGDNVIIKPKYRNDFESIGIPSSEFYIPIELGGGNIVTSGIGLSILNRRLDFEFSSGISLYEPIPSDLGVLYQMSIAGEVSHHFVSTRIPVNMYYGCKLLVKIPINNQYSNVDGSSHLFVFSGLEYRNGNTNYYSEILGVFTIGWSINLGVKIWI